MALQKRSSSSLVSLSVGSIMSVPATGKGHGGGVEAEVDEALGDVVDLEAVILEEAGVDDALVSDAALGALVEDGVGVFEAGGDVVGVEDGNAGGFCQAAAAHHGGVGVGDREDGSAAPGCGRDSAYRAFAADAGYDGMAWEEAGEMLGDAESVPCPGRRRRGGCRRSCAG